MDAHALHDRHDPIVGHAGPLEDTLELGGRLDRLQCPALAQHRRGRHHDARFGSAVSCQNHIGDDEAAVGDADQGAHGWWGAGRLGNRTCAHLARCIDQFDPAPGTLERADQLTRETLQVAVGESRRAGEREQHRLGGGELGIDRPRDALGAVLQLDFGLDPGRLGVAVEDEAAERQRRNGGQGHDGNKDCANGDGCLHERTAHGPTVNGRSIGYAWDFPSLRIGPLLIDEGRQFRKWATLRSLARCRASGFVVSGGGLG